MNDDWNQIKWHLYKKHLLRFRLWRDRKRLDKQKPTVEQLRSKLELYYLEHLFEDKGCFGTVQDLFYYAGAEPAHPMHDTVHALLNLYFDEAYYDLESMLL